MKYYPNSYNNLYLTGCGNFLPGTPIGNESFDYYIAPLYKQSARIIKRVLNDNGICTRYYGINANGDTLFSATQMGAKAVKDCLQHAGMSLSDITLLANSNSGGYVLLPGPLV